MYNYYVVGYFEVEKFTNFYELDSIHESFSSVLYSGKVWRIDSFRLFGKRKFSKLIDQPIDY